MQIMHIRAAVEGLNIDETGIAALAEIGSQTSLRYVGQLLTPARVLAVTNGKDIITASEINEVRSLHLLLVILPRRKIHPWLTCLVLPR